MPLGGIAVVLDGCGDAALPVSTEAGEALVVALPGLPAVGEALAVAFCCPELFETTESLPQAALSKMASSTINNLICDAFACEFIMTF